MTRELLPPDPSGQSSESGRNHSVHDAEFDHHSAHFAASLWEIYKSLRSDRPVAWTSTYGGFWVVSRYEDVFKVARDDDAFSSKPKVVIPESNAGILIPLESDPPRLGDYRKALIPWFTPAFTKDVIEPMIQGFVTDCIDRVIASGECDLVADLANPVTAMTTLELVGIPHTEWRVFSDPIHHHIQAAPGSSEQADSLEGISAIRTLVAAEVDRRELSPTDDLISHLTTSQTEGSPSSREFTRDEVIDMVVMVLFGGVDTTVGALGNAFVYLSQNTGDRDRLISDAGLIPSAVEEFLRFEAPIQGFARTANRDVEIGSNRIREGDRVFIVWGSANRDEAAFPDADQLQIDRFPNKHLTFGIGRHHCLGAPIARAEMRIVLEEVLKRMPDFHIVSEAVVMPDTVGNIYGPVSLPATFSPAAGEEVSGSWVRP